MSRKVPPPSLDPSHEAKRQALAKVGLGLLTVGIPCGLIGLGLFLSVFFYPPDFGMSMGRPATGLVLAGLGAFLSMFGFQAVIMANAGKILRYQAGEVLPVARDAVPHAAPMLSEMARAVAEGFSGQEDPATGPTTRHACGTFNAPSDRFCKGCGEAISFPICDSCGEQNDADARYCARCGATLQVGTHLRGEGSPTP